MRPQDAFALGVREQVTQRYVDAERAWGKSSGRGGGSVDASTWGRCVRASRCASVTGPDSGSPSRTYCSRGASEVLSRSVSSVAMRSSNASSTSEFCCSGSVSRS